MKHDLIRLGRPESHPGALHSVYVAQRVSVVADCPLGADAESSSKYAADSHCTWLRLPELICVVSFSQSQCPAEDAPAIKHCDCCPIDCFVMASGTSI